MNTEVTNGTKEALTSQLNYKLKVRQQCMLTYTKGGQFKLLAVVTKLFHYNE